MKRNETTNVSAPVLLYSKIAKIMKLTAAFLLFACLQVSAKGWSQERITLKMSQADIKKVLFAIEKKSDYRFLFTEDAMKGKPKVNIDVEQATVSEVLDKLLTNTGISYKILATNLVVLKEGVTAEQINSNQALISGRVTTATGEPLAGVSVVIKGSRTGTTTDASGNFSLTAPDDATLIFSNVGYETFEVAVGGKSAINVTLQLSNKKIDEVVVIGYGQASKRDLTGSIVKISGKEIADRPNTNPVSSLQSKVAGLYIVNNGTPGKEPDIRIRGTVSIGQVHPLYVVDGILQDNIDYVNPNEIESIEILKDPSSLAIFGVRGATGVIAVTTKRAKAGQTIVTLNTSFGTKSLVDKIEMANADQFKTLFAHEMATDGVTVPDYSAYNANTNWIDEVTRKGKFYNANIGISGASEKNKYNLGVGYISDEGIIIREKLKKYLLSFNDELRLNKAMKLGFSFNYSRQENPYNADWVLDDARKVLPVTSAGTKQFKVRDPYSGDSVYQNLYSNLVFQGSGIVNPLLQVENEWDKTISTENRYVVSLYAEVNFLKNFNFRSTWYGDMSNVNSRQYVPLYYNYSPSTNTAFLASPTTSVTEKTNDWKKFQQDYILTYKKSIGDHSFTATGGFTTYFYSNNNRTVLAKQGSTSPIPNDKRFWYISSATGSVVDPTGTNSSQNESATVSELLRVLYNYKGKYYLNASFRNDGSSRLPFHKYQNFWALGGAWEISKEAFMEKQQYVDYLKLKASIGTLGNQTATKLDGTPIYYPSYPGVQSGVFALFGGVPYYAAVPEYIASPDLRWETVNASEVGIELTAFNRRLFFEANIYNKVTKDLMTMVSRTGEKDQLVNGGSLKNWGKEFTASWNQKITNDFSVTLSGNITFMKNKVLSLAEGNTQGYLGRYFMNNGSAEARSAIGQPIGSFYGYVVNGIIQSYADKLAYYPQGGVGDYGPGDFKFKDISGTKGVPDSLITTDDRQVIGNPTPDFVYGGSVGFNYKNLSLNIDFGGVYGNEIFRTWGSLESPFQRVNYPAFKTNSWYGAGTSNWDPIISQGHRFNYNGSTYNIEDGSYFRLRNIQLAYSFTPSTLAKLKMKTLKVFLNAQNLKTWKHNSGYSPEYGGDATAFGLDFGGNAIPRIFTGGINVTF